MSQRRPDVPRDAARGNQRMRQSVEQISELLEGYFRRRKISTYCVLWREVCDEFRKKTGLVDVVLLGDAPYYFADEDFWNPRAQYRFWVLSRTGGRLLSRLIGIPEWSIGVVDRYELVPAAENVYPISESTAFVYAGRVLPDKNVAVLAQTLCLLQDSTTFADHGAVFCGPDWPASFQTEILRLPWRKPPVFLGDLGPGWKRQDFQKPAFVTLSTFRFEDFSPAIAQAQSRGIPVVATDWYGLRDLRGPGVIRVSPAPILRSGERVLDDRARLFADEILAQSGAKVALPCEPGMRLDVPEAIGGRLVLERIAALPLPLRLWIHLFFDSAEFSGRVFDFIVDLLSSDESTSSPPGRPHPSS